MKERWKDIRTGRRGKRRKQILDKLKEKREYWRSKEEVLNRTLWITQYGKGYGPVVRQASEGMNTYFAKVLQMRALCSAE
jgi:hypothetical protein